MKLSCRLNEGEFSRKIYFYKEGDDFSNILIAKAKIDAKIEEKRVEFEGKIKTAREKRREWLAACEAVGLKVVEKDSSGALEDIQKRDAEGKLIECSLIVEVDNVEKAQKAIQICKEKNLMALPIGAKTSGLGVFEAMGTANQKGFDGVLGIQMREFMSYQTDESIAESIPASALIEVPEPPHTGYELIRHKTLPLALLKSAAFPEDPQKPHRVIAHAGCSVDVVNQFLADKLHNDRYAYRIINDLTTRESAQLGGVISTGAEGGNRSKPSEDIFSTTVINGNGEKKTLDKVQSEKIIGLNGATLVTQVEFEVTAMPQHEHAIFIPIKGEKVEMWKNMLKLQQSLKKYCRSKQENGRILEGASESGFIITGMEPLSRSALDIATESSATDATDPGIKATLNEKKDQVGVYVTFRTSYAEDDFENYFMKLIEEEGMKDLLAQKCDIENHLEDDLQTTRVKVSDGVTTHGSIQILNQKEHARLDKLRHGAPSHSKEKAEQLGGQTMSSDLNIRFSSEDPEENDRAAAAVAEIYDQYISFFPPEEGFRVVLYGHLHPGLTEKGGGFDPHIRVIFELSNPHSRSDAPEKVISMKKKQAWLYQRLMALEGKHGIQIRCPEKSRFTNQEYWKWLCIYQPAEARSYLEAVEELGYSKDGAGKPDRAIIGARIPHELPGTLKAVPGGIKALLNEDLIGTQPVGEERIAGLDPILRNYWKAILEFSQLSHRGGAVKRMMGETQREIHEQFGLSEDQYSFFIESPQEAKAIVARNFGPNYASEGYRVIHVKARSVEELAGKFPPGEKTFYVVHLEGIGVPKGLSVLIAPHRAIRDAYERTMDGRNTAAFRNLYTMWEKWPHETEETPNLPAITALGLILQKKNLSRQKGKKRLSPLITTNPGPAQIHPAVLEGADELIENLQRELSPKRQKEIIRKFKEFVGIPKNHKTAFAVSATQCMQMLAETLAPKRDTVKVIQVTNDAFSERLNSVLVGEGVEVDRIQTPWTTSENSELDRVVDEMVASMDPDRKNLILLTPHKTSTTADFDPNILIRALRKKGKMVGRDYHMVCDVTSGIGARHYATDKDPDIGFDRVPFGMFGAFTKGMGQPSGTSFISLPPQVADYLDINENLSSKDEFNLARKLKETTNGKITNPIGLAMLGQKLEADQKAGRTPEKIQEETRKKVYLLLGWMERHPDLMTLTPNALDASPLLFGIFSQSKNLVVAKRILADVFGYYIGGGYGAPYEKEAIRLYLPNIAYDDLENLLAALDHVLQLDDVVKTRGEKKPNIALREPHNPLGVLERLMNDFSVDDIFKDSSGLHWLERVFKTWNANQTEATDKVGMDVFDSNGSEYTIKAKIYGHKDNLGEMRKIVELKDGNDKSIVDHYKEYLLVEKEIREKITRNPEAKYMEDADFTGEMDLLIARAKTILIHIALLLRKYVGIAARDKKGRIVWPVVA